MKQILMAIASVFAYLHTTADSAEPDIARPNIILMMADDMGMGDTSAYQDFTGNSDIDQIHTPNMDRLARMGVRFTDAHTPSTRCTGTRYGLLTGRYPWRNRMKHWVLFGVQGDPMIERDRPTLGTMLQDHEYRTGLVGKWHVGLRYRQSNGRPADGWEDADLTQPMFDTPLDHGFDFCRITSRSHGTSGPNPVARNKAKRNSPTQSSGPGHVHGRTIVGATGNGKQLVDHGPHAYVLSELGGRHLDSAMEFLNGHLANDQTSRRPFFLYYPSNSNHGPHTPDDRIRGVQVAGAARNVAGNKMNVRSDYIYENDVVLGHLIDFLQSTEDPRNPGNNLDKNTIVIFTSDNGAEIKDKTATGPFRSNKGSAYEGGHRVPFIVAWPAGRVGDGDDATDGLSSDSLMGLQDLFATFADVLGAKLPDVSAGEKGGEDSISVLAAWRGQRSEHSAVFINDHNEAKQDKAVLAVRVDDPLIDGRTASGQWKLFLDPKLLRAGIADPIELFDLRTDPRETNNLVDTSEHQAVVQRLTKIAVLHRTAGGHRLAPIASTQRFQLSWSGDSQDDDPDLTRVDMRHFFGGQTNANVRVELTSQIVVNVAAVNGDGTAATGFNMNPRGLGVTGGSFDQVDDSESIVIEFNHDVIMESASIVAGNGQCGGYYQIGNRSPLAIYCVDADIDSQDQSGILSDIGVLKAGQKLRLSSGPHYGVEAPGRWRVAAISFRSLK